MEGVTPQFLQSSKLWYTYKIPREAWESFGHKYSKKKYGVIASVTVRRGVGLRNFSAT